MSKTFAKFSVLKSYKGVTVMFSHSPHMLVLRNNGSKLWILLLQLIQQIAIKK